MYKNQRILSAVFIAAAVLFILSLVFASTRMKEFRLSRQALSLLSDGRYEEAMELYRGLDNEEMVNECLRLIMERTYMQAKGLMNSGRYEEAEEIFSSISGYRDADSQVLQCRYLFADRLFSQGDSAQAMEIFKALGDFSDSRLRFEETELSLYVHASELTKDGRFAQALDIYRLLGSYESSEMLAERCRARVSMAEESGRAIISEENVFARFDKGGLYIADCGYVFVPNNVDENTDFMIFFPGGRDIEEPPEYVYNYIDASQGGTLALFLYKNGLYNMTAMSEKALRTLTKAAGECGAEMKAPLLCGSSMGAYPAMHAAEYYLSEHDMVIPRVICFDAGVDWEDEELLLNESECLLLAKAGTQFWLFEQQDVGMNRSGIAQMVCSGCEVTVIACTNGEHNAILYDALDCGMIEYALGRVQRPDNYAYTYTVLDPLSTYPE